MEYKLRTKPIDEQDPRYIDYLKTTEHPTWIGYQNYCGDLFFKEQNASLEKHANRNEIYLNEINHMDTFLWLQNYFKQKPTEMHRDEVGNEFFDILLSFNGCYNSLMMELSRDELDGKSIKYFLDRIKEKRQVLETLLNNE